MTNDVASSALRHSSERPAQTMSGYAMLLLLLVLLVATPAFGIWNAVDDRDPLAGLTFVVGGLAFVFVAIGFYLIQPNQAVVITLFGDYRGSDRAPGLHWTWPWMGKRKVSVRANNIISDKIKVNDLRGNPIEMAAQVVWRVTDTAQAVFDVDDYKAFVMVQIEGSGAHDRLALSL